MDPIVGFNAALRRAEHLITLYALVHDTRIRSVRSDWSSTFKELMRWPQNENIVRVDGSGQNSMLILRETVGIDRSHFSHVFASEMLRASVVALISALDRFLHDLVLHHCIKLLRQPDASVPTKLKNLAIPIIEVKRAIDKGRADSNSRPGHIVKKAIQNQLHTIYTFQKPDDIIVAMKMLGVEDFWNKVCIKLPDNPTRGDVIEKIRSITKRRNQIVHEADLYLKTSSSQLTLRDIRLSEAEDWLIWIRNFGSAIDEIVKESV